MNTEQKGFFSDILANPAKVGADHAPQLAGLVELYPQSGILHALLARAMQAHDAEGFQQKLKTAAVYAADRSILYNLINHPEKFAGANSTIVVKPEAKPVQEIEPSAFYFHEPQVPGSDTGIDDEVFDEITSIEDIQINPGVQPQIDGSGSSNLEDLIIAQYGWTDVSKVSPEANTGSLAGKESEEKAGYSLSNSDFKSRMSASAEDEDEYPEQEEVNAESDAVTYEFADAGGSPTEDDLRLSKYNDDKMPYSFMWWLDKTRKEHATNNQPYAPYKPSVYHENRLIVSEELQQQYYENIFHTTAAEELEKSTVKPEVEIKRKEDEIIERFIQEDPQIKAPSNDTLDNENKAKKSAEDEDEMVSETLARIYLDQMLYHKAISTYQKLLLKFPEKSSYFVAQIKLLEKKIN